MNDGEIIALRPVAESDLPAFGSMFHDPEVAAPFQWFGFQDPTRLTKSWAENGMLGPDGGRLVVVAGAETLGVVSWRKIDVAGSSYFWNIGILLLPAARGRGIGTEAQRQLVRYLFAHTPVVRIEADTDIENIAEQRALEKAGFSREGVLRSVVFRDGRYHDGVVYGITRDDLAKDATP